MDIKIATFNLENMFTRPAAMDGTMARPARTRSTSAPS
jgi:hypothetical protein